MATMGAEQKEDRKKQIVEDNQNNSSITIYLKSMEGITDTMTISATTSIGEIASINERESRNGFRKEQMRFIFNHEALCFDSTLANHNLEDQDAIYLILTLSLVKHKSF